MKELDNILNSGMLSAFRGTPDGQDGGEYIQALEAAFRNYFGVRYALTLNSATSALHAALIACDIGEGDEVIVSPYSFSSSASCALMVGAKPVFADICDDTFCIDPEQVEALITPKTRAIIPVHLFGHPADMYSIMDIAEIYSLVVIEDAAQAIGAKYDRQYVGTIGDCGVFSFNQSKHINTGEGGMLVTNNDKIAEVVKAVRNHSEVSHPEFKIVGYNYRMCEIEAALALEQFLKLDKMIGARKSMALHLSDRLSGKVEIPVIKEGIRHAWWAYAIKTKRRDEYLTALLDADIACDRYVEPLYNLPIYEKYGYERGMCPVAERMWELEMLRIDMGNLTEADCDTIIRTIYDII